MPPFVHTTSPPVLSVPRQPSPLSFSGRTAEQFFLPTTNTSQPLPSTVTADSISLAASTVGSTAPLIQRPRREASLASPSPRPSSPSRIEALVPTGLLPDSLLCRSTFSALEHSATILKRLSKAVLASTSIYLDFLEQFEKIEDDLMTNLSELGRWLEGGYGLSESVWEVEGGIRKMRNQQRRREREELESMVEHSLIAVKTELKRTGLAGGGAQTRFENTAKHFYHQTSVYLSPQPTTSIPTFSPGPAIPSHYPTAHADSSVSSSSSHKQTSSPAASASLDRAQAARMAHYDLARYSHHSTLLYAVPPSSIGCLDLLVGLYGWVGGLLGESLGRQHGDLAVKRGSLTTSPTPATKYHELAPLEPLSSSLPTQSVGTLKLSLAESLACLGQVRSDLLQGWALRNQQTSVLENESIRRQDELDGACNESFLGQKDLTISSRGIEHKKAIKNHKFHRSVGGRLRGLLTSGGSAPSLAGIASGDKSSRASLDGVDNRGDIGTILARLATMPRARVSEEIDTSITPMPGSPIDGDHTPQTSPLPSPLPLNISTSRPTLPFRHSIHVPREPFLPQPFLIPPDPPSVPTKYGGVGGLNGSGDEDGLREEVGRKKEGVLWGAGSWEGLTKPGGKGKWEKFWVVLDRSKIYEYRNNGIDQPESSQAVIDLKFASVREGRGTDRRFVFEIVTSTQGRRLYQATSDQEMKQWLYAICNAIESSINGTSSIRTFDASKLRSVSVSLDEYALPVRSKQSFPFLRRSVGLGSSAGQETSTSPNRQSMPPLPRLETNGALNQQRRASMKRVFRQSGDMLSTVTGSQRNSLDAPKPPFLAQVGRMGSKISLTSGEDIRLAPFTSTAEGSPSSTASRSSQRVSWHEESPDGDIEKRVLEMAGLGLGLSSSTLSSSKRRVKSEGVAHLSTAEAMVRSRAANDETGKVCVPDMTMLRRIANNPGNDRCADCSKGMKSSRWATLSLREVPMVLFICIRCCGIHRSLGTHISKPRSVELDTWSPQSILIAKEWGNEKANIIWEKRKPAHVVPNDEEIGDFIRAKYVEGRWLAEEDRKAFGLEKLEGQGKAL